MGFCWTSCSENHDEELQFLHVLNAQKAMTFWPGNGIIQGGLPSQALQILGSFGLYMPVASAYIHNKLNRIFFNINIIETTKMTQSSSAAARTSPCHACHKTFGVDLG